MGNTVSAAEAVASGITHVKADNQQLPPIHKTTSTPPPECPMHQKVATPAASECPIKGPDDNSDINPYNMVNCHFFH